ncbi:MAG: hypothetical protein ACYC0O_05750 [Desulfurivibrionaceae bacterium]|jgi:hypothetical protein|nr:hypothetical protein [Pseudomonadota bacterium]MBU4412071.1 hypothetical protein [Pseudomonadota bacterium]MCG2824222.1 hypothetical protein [Desulfobulbaceae bacterium]MDP2002001.1 hypothetical protein [Desulfurivibrionaceae bacterium]MDP2757014.1 hypothetical protein [Desulfurivibrionaceae bacterium]
MTTPCKPFRNVLLTTILALTSLAALSGCAELGLGTRTDQGVSSDPFASSAASSTEQPYRANEFSDILIPSEFDWDREKSMVVRTDSFAGGVLQYNGRVDISSSADFFSNNMPRNGWKLAGSTRYKNVLLAFTKPNKTCTIVLTENKLLMRTEIAIYVTEDIAAGRVNSANPFGSGL